LHLLMIWGRITSLCFGISLSIKTLSLIIYIKLYTPIYANVLIYRCYVISSYIGFIK
jgi:predicted membrane protein